MKWARRIMLIVGVLAMAAGIFLLLNLAAPVISTKKDITKISVTKSDQIVIPEVGISAPIVAGGSEALEKGAWHRFPERGNPVDGGNMILSAHSFIFAWNPLQTRENSYFYNLHKLNVGEKVYVDWQGKRYTYKVSKMYEVKPNAVDIEAPSKDAHLTIYTCTPGGSADGRVVVEAIPE